MDNFISDLGIMDLISIVLAVLIFFSPYYFKKFLSKKNIASLTITLGITGTFLGVFIGLLLFKVSDLNNSVPELIQGLRTAFLTSLAGLTANIILKTRKTPYGIQEELTNRKQDNVGELIVHSLEKLNNSISGDDDTTLITQLQKIRTTNSDGLEKMNNSFSEFAEKMVADNTQSLIDALTQVMQDFNTQINEQFGENFKQLNEGVGAMLRWQEEYKDHVEKLNGQFDKIVTNLDSVDKSLENTAKSHDKIYETNEVLEELLKDLSVQVNSMADLGAQAKESFPRIEKNMQNLTETSNDFVRNNLKSIQEQYDSFTNTQNQLADNYKRNIEKLIADNAERVKQLDTELGNELNKSLESLGNQLTSLSQHFVNDYKPLTQKLKEVVNLANRLN